MYDAITPSISIHALLAESDPPCCGAGPTSPHFYPRSPCGERHSTPFVTGANLSFLSTLSLRRATGELNVTGAPLVHFYPRSPCGERLSMETLCQVVSAISIHALLAESDSQQPDGTTKTTYFYPRSPCGERRYHQL